MKSDLVAIFEKNLEQGSVGERMKEIFSRSFCCRL